MNEWQKAGFSPAVMKAVDELASLGYPGDLMAAAQMFAHMETEKTMARLQHSADLLTQASHPAKRKR